MLLPPAKLGCSSCESSRQQRSMSQIYELCLQDTEPYPESLRKMLLHTKTPWSTWPMVPMFMCGLLRWKTYHGHGIIS